MGPACGPESRDAGVGGRPSCPQCGQPAAPVGSRRRTFLCPSGHAWTTDPPTAPRDAPQTLPDVCSSTPLGDDPELEDELSLELLEELRRDGFESDHLRQLAVESPGHASPLFRAKVEADEAARRYRALREQVRRLNSPDTSWAERLSLLAEFEATGWRGFKATVLRQPPQGGAVEPQELTWSGLRLDWLYRGREWRIPISDEDCERIARLGQGGEDQNEVAWFEAVGDVLRTWYQRDATLAPQILHDPDGVRFLSAWVACRIWAGRDDYARWLMKEIVEKALRGIKPGVDVTREDKEDLVADATIRLISKIIPGRIYRVHTTLTGLWRKSCHRYVKALLKERTASKALEQAPEGHDLELLDRYQRQQALRQAQERLEQDVDLLEADRLFAALSPRQRWIVQLTTEGHSQPEVAETVGVSTSTVQKELHEIHQQTARQTNRLT